MDPRPARAADKPAGEAAAVVKATRKKPNRNAIAAAVMFLVLVGFAKVTKVSAVFVPHGAVVPKVTPGSTMTSLREVVVCGPSNCLHNPPKEFEYRNSQSKTQTDVISFQGQTLHKHNGVAVCRVGSVHVMLTLTQRVEESLSLSPK